MNKIKNILSMSQKFILMFCLIFNLTHTAYCLDGECDFSDVNHHGPRVLCLGKHPNLKREQLDDFFTYHLKPNTISLDLRCQPNLDDSHLIKLAESPQAAMIAEINLSRTNVTYDGIAALWRSPVLGSHRDDPPLFERYYNLPVSVIKVEIGHTPALETYKDMLSRMGRKIYPFPMREQFNISFWTPYNRFSNPQQGFKDVILMDHGEILK